jgi:alpha-1,3/alpha-1,6-mannosyltransferase
MRVSIVVFTANGFGGGNKFAADLMSALREIGHDVAVCAWDRPVPGRCHEEFLDVPPERWFIPRFRYNLGKLYKITFNLASTVRRCADNFKPEVVINTTTEPSVLHLIPMSIKRVSFVHYPTELTAYGHSLKYEVYRSIYWWMHYKAIGNIDAIVCNSNYIKEITYLMWKCSLPDRTKYHTIYPCVDVQRFGVKEERERKVCCVGRIDRNKGIDVVVDAFLKAKGSVPEAKLEIVGGVRGSPWAEAYYPSLVSRLNQIRDERISLKVDVPSSEITRALMTSRCMANFNPEEHFGIVPVEAMAAGTPPIVADGGGQRETVLDGETGYLVHSKDEMADAMVSLLSDDAAFAMMSRAGRRRAASVFSKGVFAKKWDDLFATLK